MASRNPVSDLIFDDVREDRVNKVVSLWTAANHQRSSPCLDRATVFVTHACNFRCAYCNGPMVNPDLPPEKRHDFLSRNITPDFFEETLNVWKSEGLKHIHFTGGEATLNPHLPAFVLMARERGIATSLTTNGSASPKVYQSLVANGLQEIRVSIDTHDAKTFDDLTGVQGAFARVDRTLRSLADLRERKEFPCFTILNVSLREFDLSHCIALLDHLLDYQPDDMKLLIIAEDARRIEEAASRSAVDTLLAVLKNRHPAGFGLLEWKIRHLFRKNAFGLAGMAARHLMRRCFIPLTERTIDGRFVYPCSLYVRGYGEPLAPVSASFAEQQAASWDFVENHNCLADPICSANCSTCCREFNLEANRRLTILERDAVCRQHPVIEIAPIMAQETARIIGDHFNIENTPSPDATPFMIIKPFGMPWKDEIIAYLESQKLCITKTEIISDWHNCALYLYMKKRHISNAEKVRLKATINRGFRSFEKSEALALFLEKAVPPRKLYRIKSELRRWLGEDKRVLRLGSEDVTLVSNAVHAPDAEDIAWQNQVLEYFTAKGPAAK